MRWSWAGTGKVIVNIYCGLREYEAREVGFIINKDYQRCGYAAEALSSVIGTAFREGAHRVYGECDPRNVPSWRLMEKVGMRREACLRENVWFRKDEKGAPVWKDTYVYGILAKDRAEKEE